MADTINGMDKAEMLSRRSWPTREAVELATLEWVARLSRRGLVEHIGYVSPAEAEANYYQQLANQVSNG